MAMNFARPPELLQARQFNTDKGRRVAPFELRDVLNYETCTSVDTTQYPAIIIKAMNEAASALISIR
jgi:hypothetical protein